MDLHAEQIQGFFDIPVDNLYAQTLFYKTVQKLKGDKLAIVAPDVGSIKLARAYATHFKADMAIVDKRRVTAKKVEPDALIGNVEHKDVLLVDDLCSTGETLIKASWVCKRAGARRIYAAVTHGLFASGMKALEESAIEKIYVSNTVPLPDGVSRKKVEVVSVADLFARAIDTIVHAGSVSSLFKE